MQEEKAEFYSPMPVQEQFHRSEAKRIMLAGGVRSGKTRAVGQELYWWLTGTHPFKKTPPPPVYARWAGSGMEEHVQKVLVEMMRQIIPRNVLEGDKFNYSKDGNMLRFKNGSWLEFMSFDQDPSKGAGRALHIAGLDDLGCPKRFMEQTSNRLTDFNGVLIRSICPEDGIVGWEYDWLERASSGELGYEKFKMISTENPYLSKEGLAQLLADIGDDEIQRRIRIEGDFLEIGGAIYPMIRRDVHHKTAAEVCSRFGVPWDQWTKYVAIDPGINKDHAVLWGAVGPGGHIHFYRELSISGPIHPDLKQAIRTKSGLERIAGFRIDGHWDWDNRTGVSADGVSALNLHREFFLEPAMPVMKAPLDIKMWLGIDQVKARLRPDPTTGWPGITFEPDLVETWDEMVRYSCVPPKKSEPTRHAPKIRKVDDDFPDCVRIFVTSDLTFEGIFSPYVNMRSDVMTDDYGIGW